MAVIIRLIENKPSDRFVCVLVLMLDEMGNINMRRVTINCRVDIILFILLIKGYCKVGAVLKYSYLPEHVRGIAHKTMLSYYYLWNELIDA